MQQLYIQILDEIKKANNILLLTHKNPDGDALGSVCAWACFLENLNKKYLPFCFNSCPAQFEFLPCVKKIESNELNLDIKNHDLIIALDCADWSRANFDYPFEEIKKSAKIINIDHHFTNDGYGHFNLIDPTASSTCEIIYNLFDETKIKIEKDIATCLLTGIMTDTDNFSNAATTLNSLNISSQLLLAGGRLNKVQDNTIKNKNVPILKLWGRILMRLEKNKKFDMAYTIITREDIEEFNIDLDAIEGVSNFLNSLSSEAKVILVLREEEGDIVKGSLRTTDDKVDVAKLAKQFGGGGHKKAAGFNLKGRIVQKNGQWQVV